MKFAVTAVSVSRRTRRRCGKARVEIVDTSSNPIFGGVTEPEAVEARYEAFWNHTNPDSPTVVKVVDVRPA